MQRLRIGAARGLRALPWLTFSVILLAAAGCVPAVPGSTGSSSGGSSGAHSSSGGGSSGANSSSGASSSGGAQCAGTSSKAQLQALDIYIMLDRSLSMEDAVGTSTKWGAVSSALSSFVGQPMDGTSVGLQYFPQEDLTSWEGNACAASAYAKPEVEIGPLATTAPLIRSSIASQQLQSGTPTTPALQGALDHARAWASDASHGGHAVVVVFATDGEPTTCNSSISKARSAAAAAVAATPSVRTFVIGLGNLTNLNEIAAAGGTTSAFIVDTSGSVSADFLKALNAIRTQAVGCSYAIPAPPAGQTLDYGLVNVEYQRGGTGAATSFVEVPNATKCGTNATAWYYDDNAAPTSIVLCPSTCAAVEADPAASVRIVLGCTTKRDGTEW
jgi:hypothetical protein